VSSSVGARGTLARGTDAVGQIVGSSRSNTGSRGFVATPCAGRSQLAARDDGVAGARSRLDIGRGAVGRRRAGA
jgi:hypothetical protein